MKALSIQQPYSFAITMGHKPVENRTWSTRFRGPVLIHAGKRELKDDVDGVLRQIAAQTVTSLEVIERGYYAHRWLGAIVGAATITDCVTAMGSPWFCGPYGFVLEKPIWSNRVDCRGALGFFDVPDHVLSRLDVPPYVETSSPSDNEGAEK